MGDQSISGFVLERKYAALLKSAEATIRSLTSSIDIGEISRHNYGYRRYSENPHEWFVEAERFRYLRALDLILSSKTDGTVCDLGCFIPFLPVCLSLAGLRVKIVDKYSLYSEAFKAAIERTVSAHGIEIFDLDLLRDDFSSLGKNDIVLMMAVIEHLNGSPKALMEKSREIIRQGGFLLFEVPNLAEFSRRFSFLRGKSPLPNYEDYFLSEYPFAGHNREMTVEEVEFLFSRTRFAIDFIDCYDYHEDPIPGLWFSVHRWIRKMAPVKNKGQAILVQARPMP